jgi:hypothetical protein
MAIGALFVRIVIHGMFLTVLYLVSVMISALLLIAWPQLNIPGMPVALTVLITTLLYGMALFTSFKAGFNILHLKPLILALPVAMIALLVEPLLAMPVRPLEAFDMDYIQQVWAVLGGTIFTCLMINFLFLRSPS